MFDRNFVVLELANILAGPVTGMFFAELGARVIKVENPNTGGDATRGWKLAGETSDSDISAYFSCANWGKESLACDVTQAAGRDVVHALVARADIVIASFKPGDETKLGLDYETLSAINPGLLYGQITAYGADDPRPGFDAILQAEAGFTYLNGEPDGPPTKMPVALIDLLLAHQLKEGLLLALLKRERGGGGALITTSLFEAGIASLANQATNYLVGGTVPQRMGSEHPNIVPYGTILACADGRELVIAAATEKQYRALMSALGLESLSESPAYATGQNRVRNRDALLKEIRERAARVDAASLAARLETSKVPFGFVNDMAAVFSQPAANRLQISETQDGRELKGVRSFSAESDAFPPVPLSAPPHMNQHATRILTELLDYTPEIIEKFQKSGAFGTTSSDN